MYNEVKLKLQIFLSTIIFFVTVLLFQQFVLPQLLNEGDLIFFCRKNRSRALPVQVEENTFEDCPSFSRIFCFKYKFIYLPRCMMKNKEETPIKPIIREKMLKLQYPRSWNLSKYKYFLKIRVAVFFVESWISRSVLYRVIVLTGSKLVLYQNDKTPKSQPEAFLDEGFLWNSSSGWLLGIFWFRYWTGGGQLKKTTLHHFLVQV